MPEADRSHDGPKKDAGKDQSPIPSISLPKGGGAIRGIGEKFAANPVTGTGSMSVPIFTSPGRSGFGPQLSLSYDSGAGNGPFGFGWSLSLPSITRKTDKGLPRYRDSEESDEFILSGAEDLVPVLVPADGGEWKRQNLPPQIIDGRSYRVECYRPRIEGLFARIERWTRTDDPKDVCWRSISKDNITTWYGKTPNSRIADPADLTHIFSWLICESYDDKGNTVVYEYVPEDSRKIDASQAHEANRTEASRSANRYLKRIKYGNRTPNRDAEWQATDPAALPGDGWMFEVVFDYEEGHYEKLPLDPQQRQFVKARQDPEPARPWPARLDPFSSYRAGFEVRTYRLCRRVLMFHHFPDELGTPDYLVRSTEFTYRESPIASFITSVTQSGYVRQTDETYLKKSLPPLEFAYTEAVINEKLEEIDARSLENLPSGLDGSRYQWVDLDGEGISGVLTEQADAWFYKPNLGEGKFGPLELVANIPSTADLSSHRQQFLDLAGDGQLDLVEFGGTTPGFFERTEEQGWEFFTPFASLPGLAWDDPNLKFVDLTGDGHADVLISEDEVFTWHPSLAEAGFGPAERVRQAFDEEKGPKLVFADGTQSIYLADLSGDGLTDLVRIRNGEVCYWPNLGYGHFGAKVTMDNAPWFDRPDLFNQQRIRLADIDGSGTTDLIYLGCDQIAIFRNQAGNTWSDPEPLACYPRVDNLASVVAVDLLGNGTACLVWSSPLPGDARQPMRYIDLMGGQKPHLLVSIRNNLGAETRVQYAPSTKFYLADKLAGQPWITRIPFPVHVVERVETYDYISRNRFVTRYAYHHGYYDGIEREFRGFGMVEQWDTEEFAALSTSDVFPTGDNIDQASHVPPVLTRTWFHTGVYDETDEASQHFASEYYGAPETNDPNYKAKFDAFFKALLPDTVLPSNLTLDEERESCRALKGSMLRQEVYALDGTDKEKHPYTVTEQNFTIRALQSRGANRHAVFFTHARESIAYHYEREPADPRVGHALTLDVDRYGNILKSAAIGYGRRQPDVGLSPADQAKQTQVLITYTENGLTKDHDTGNDAIDQDNDYRTPLPCESRTYELIGLTLPAGTDRFTFDDVLDAGTTAIALDYEKDPTAGRREKRLIEHVRTYYRRNDLAGPLPLGKLQSLALPFESYKLAFTRGLVSEVYGGRTSDAMLGDEGRYVHTEGDANWWIPSGRIFYSPDPADTPPEELAYARRHFFLPHRYRDPFHTDAVSTESFVTYDRYELLVHETTDALSNQVTVGERQRVFPDGTVLPEKRRNDYRVLQPALVMDPNRNCSEVRFDALGMVVGTAVMGKPEENPRPGDRLTAAFRADLTQAEIDQFLAKPQGPVAATLLADATTRVVYDLTAYWREPDPTKKPPALVATLARETHASEPVPAGGLRIQASFSYSDGFGREIQKKIQAEPGPVPTRDANGKVIVGADGQPQMTPNDVSPRWVGSGWTVFNNKGKPVRQYEPFFTDIHRFEFDVKIGVSPVLFYDPVERAVATLHPNHTWEKMVFDPWRQETWDVNDTVVLDPQTDPDLKGFLLHPDGTPRLPVTEYEPSWYALRTDAAHAAAFAARYPDPTDRTNETRAAEKTRIHAATRTVAHTDSLGRTFLTVAHNKFKYSDTPAAAPPVEEFHSTRIILDIEGNQCEVIDAKDRVVMRYDYDMLGNRVHQASMEAGERWMLNDVAGKPLCAWDSRDHRFRTAYDPLRRPTDSFLSESGSVEKVVGRSIYGESRPNPEAGNLRGKVVELRDQAGVVTSDKYDFKGNLLESSRRLAQDYKSTLDWSGTVPLEPETYTSRTRYDALNRPTQLIAPHSAQPGATVNVIQPIYNEANLLDQVHAWLNRDAEPADWLDPATADLHAVIDIDYNAKGQRERIAYGNGAVTTYDYDRLTFRLAHLLTRRKAAAFPSDCPQPPPAGWPGCQVQNLHYTYDPAGNITHIRDDAQQTIYFRNKRVEPSAEYTYDAIYRLIEATGREHLGQVGGAPIAHSYNDVLRVGLHPGDGNAMGRYLEHYIYDAVGNFLEMQHRGSHPAHPGWTRTYAYSETSQLEPGKQSNRLTSTAIGGTPETYSVAGDGYDAHGNMLRMPHLQVMQWDFKDQLQMTQRQKVNDEDADGVQHHGERTWYVYDSAGQRVRKVTERATGQVRDERIYLDGFEIYRENGANPLVRETLHIMDDKRRIALVESRTQGNDPAPPQLIRYQFSNYLGSASLELDDQAQIISYEEYTPYGSTSYQAVRSQTETPKRYRFTGKERDEENGLYYHGARYYAPWLSRWMACDPAGLVDGPNKYQYAIANPIGHSDPTGTQHLEQGTADDPVVMGCAGATCYMNIPQSRLRELQGQARVQQQLDTGAAIASNPFSGLFWGIARLFTNDPNKQAAAAQLGVATFGIAAAAAGVAAGREQIRGVAPVEPQRPVAAEVRAATTGRAASAGAPPSSGVARPPGPPAATPPPPAPPPPPPAPPPRPQLDVLVVGAETAGEFAYARRVAQQGGNVTVVNPTATAEARAYQRAGGNFVQGRVEELPPSARFNLIREDYPFPLGRAFTPSQQFVEARLGRLTPGGTWVVVTESSEFVQALEAAGTYSGARVTVNQIPQAHEATPQSTYPRETTRYVVTFTR
jgi:RHS repeat-associated protein